MTNAAQHTPGPWDANGCNVYTYRNGAREVVASIHGTHADTTEQADATARLIAAAPALYEALRETLRQIERVDDGRFQGAEWLAVARAALAAVDGAK